MLCNSSVARALPQAMKNPATGAASNYGNLNILFPLKRLTYILLFKTSHYQMNTLMTDSDVQSPKKKNNNSESVCEVS